MPRSSVLLTAGLLTLTGWSPPLAAEPLDIEAELALPEVRLLVVEFFATWCEPCLEAVPRWQALRQRYGDQGLRLVVVAVKDDAERCANVPWTPDRIICDQDGALARRFGVQGLPAAFLWNWQGHLLGDEVHVDEVEAKIEDWMLATPRVAVRAEVQEDATPMPAEEIEQQISSQLSEVGKLIVVASPEERARLRALARSSLSLGSNAKLQCSVGQEVSANSLLEATVTRGGHQLRLGLLSVESHCRTRDVYSPWRPEDPGKSITEAVAKLVVSLRRPYLQRPAALQLADGWSSASVRDRVELEARLARAEAIASAAQAETERLRKEVADREAEARARTQKAHAEALARVERAWASVASNAIRTALPREERIAALDRFLTEFPTDNPRADVAEAYRARLTAGQEPRLAPSGMVEVPGGPFFMGCNPDFQLECGHNERPGQTINLPAFFIDRHEVTVEAYAVCVEAGGCSPRGLSEALHRWRERPELTAFCNWGQVGRGQHPVNCVDWFQARAYCAYRGKRLPTEAEWEKAARGTDGRRFPWGNSGFRHGPRANVADEAARSLLGVTHVARGYNDGAVGTSPVGTYPAGRSPYGVDDMGGNVGEWTVDALGGAGKYRVQRGGTWYDTPGRARTSFRSADVPSARDVSIGFRCVRTY